MMLQCLYIPAGRWARSAVSGGLSLLLAWNVAWSDAVRARARAPVRPAVAATARAAPHMLPREFTVQLLTPSLEASISSRPGEYPALAPLRLKVISSQPGWSLRADATHLKIEVVKPAEHIRAQEVFGRCGENDPFPLATPSFIVETGPEGETTVEMHVLLVTGEFHRPGEYRGEIRILPVNPARQDATMLRIPFTVVVKARVEHAITGQKVYFHFGKCNESQSAQIHGRLSADMPVALVLSAATGRVTSIPQVKPMAGAHPAASGIPVDWQLRVGASTPLRGPDALGSAGQSVSWVLESTPGEIDYVLECRLRPEAYQPPGDYAFEVLVNLVPVF